MQSDPGFQARLAAQSLRIPGSNILVQRHPRVEHLDVVVLIPHRRMTLGPARPPRLLQVFVQRVHEVSLEELGRLPDLDPHLALLTLPVRPEHELAASSQRILARRPDLDAVVLPMLMRRFPRLSREEIRVIAGIPLEEIRHTRAAQEWLAEGRQEDLPVGLQEGRQQESRRGRHPAPAQPPLRPASRSHDIPD